MSKSNRKYPNAHQVELVEKAFAKPRTVAEAATHCGVPQKHIEYAIRILGFKNLIVRTDDGKYKRCEK
jgi:predicted transcriptional regulator